MARSDADKMIELLFTPEKWINRRVEAVHFLDSGETRRVVSIDFTLPKECRIRESPRRVIIPVAFRLKEPLRNLDTFDQSGAPLSVLRASDAAPRSAAVLQRFARNVAPDLAATTLVRLDELLTRIVTLPADDATRVAAVIRRWVALSWPGGITAEAALFVDVVEAFSRSFVLMLELPDDVVGVRSMLKFSYELPVDILEGAELPYNLELDGPQLWMSDSCHLEIATPPGVQIRELVVRDRGSGRQWRDPASNVPTLAAGHRAHVVCRRTAPLASGSTLVSFDPDNRSIIAAAVLSTWAAFVAFLLPPALRVIEATTNLDLLSRGISESAVSLLLLGPAALVAFLGRAPEHQLVARVLWPLRRAILATVLTLIAAAAIVGTRVQLPWDSWITWCVLAAVQLVSVVHITRIWARVHRLTYTGANA
ncbi:MAG: hypothetical protein L0K86_04275 [Actinomycetia bacterium]|nr:hypothetical protein [Actinomycetes bacterium]